MPTDNELLATAYKFFNARDIDAVFQTMHKDVDWPNGLEGGRVRGYGQVRDYWTRQWAMLDPHVEPVSFAKAPDGRTVVQVHQVVKDLSGKVIVDHMVQHVYRIRDGLIESMEVLPADPA
jgi:SnoaL-like domain